MAALDIKWSFREDFIEVKDPKVPLFKSGEKKKLLVIKRKPEKNECVELSHLKKDGTVNLYPTSELEIPPSNEMNVLLKPREKTRKKFKKGNRDV